MRVDLLGRAKFDKLGGMKRTFGLALAALLMLVPQLDQVLCAYCGPSPESYVIAKHHLDLQALSGHADGSQETSVEPPLCREEEGPNHYHFCTLHSTFLELVQMAALDCSLAFSTPGEKIEPTRTPIRRTIDHPPQS